MLPFTTEQFLSVFERYNLAIWPMQLVAYVLGLIVVGLAARPARHTSRIVSAILAFFWIWTGAVYHLTFFRQINGAAALFGALFIFQGLLFLLDGTVRQRLTFRAGTAPLSIVGWLFVAYAMAIYPVLGTLLGHGYPSSPTFGVTPCPLTIFTFGVLLWTRAETPLPRYVLIIPFLWSLLGPWAAAALGIREDLGLLIAGLLGTALLLWRRSHISHPRHDLRRRFA